MTGDVSSRLGLGLTPAAAKEAFVEKGIGRRLIVKWTVDKKV
jgi:hypothetical protein